MKNYLALALAMTIIASPAFASRARLESLGEGKNGSYYIQDSRNIFLNPAQIVHYKKKLFLELGVESVGSQDAASVYTVGGATVNRPQGGFTNTFGDFTYGLYLNNTSDRSIGGVQAANAVAGAGNFIAPDSALELFFAGESAVNWGISLFYAGNNTRAAGTLLERTANYFGTRLGVEAGNLQVFTTVGITSSSKLNNATAALAADEIKGKVSVDAGVTYGMENATVFGKFATWGSDINAAATGTAVIQNRNTAYGVGAGWKHDMTKATTMYARVEGDYVSNSTSGAPAAAVNTATRGYNVPLVLAAETAALSWLTIRGSIAESLIGAADFGGARTSLGGTTTVSAGLGLTFGDLVIDGLVATDGTVNPNANVNSYTGFGTAPQTNTGFGFGNGMLTRVAMTYNF